MSVSIFIAGDVVPRMGQHYAPKAVNEKIFDPIKPYIAKADISVANLEAPVVIGERSPIKKSGPNLYTSKLTVEVLRNVGFSVLTLANNHFFDQGQQGVDDTIDICKQLGINIVGGGKTFCQARKPLFLKSKDKLIAIINACEHEFSIANADHGGSNPLDLILMQESIAAVRKQVDYVIVIVHGGVEQYQYPTPRMKRWYRHFVDLGADVVANHHQHCVNGYEVYKHKPIFYGLGNFYFPQRERVPSYNSWGKGYAVSLSLDDTVGFELIPYNQDANGIKLYDKNEFEKEIELLNLPIADDFLLQQKFDHHIIDGERNIEVELLPSFLRNRMGSALARRGYFGNLYQGKQVFSLKNKLTCESHLEKLQRLFTILSK